MWYDYTNEDGTGIYFDVLRAVFPNDKLSINHMPFSQSHEKFNQNEIDIVIGVYKDELPNAYFPKWHLDNEYPITAYFTKELDISRPSDLIDKRFVWLEGYHFERYLSSRFKPQKVTSIEAGLTMINNRNADVFIDYSYNLTPEEKKFYSSIEIFPSRHVYVAFQRNMLGRALAQRFDIQMEKLRNNGTLGTIYRDSYAYSGLEPFNLEKPNLLILSNSVSLLGPPKNSRAQSLHFIFDEMMGYEFEFKQLKDIEEIYRLKNRSNVCFTDLIKTEQRLKHFISSRPVSLYLGLQLFSTTKLNYQSPLSIRDILEKQPDMLLGSVNGRSYGEELDNLFNSVKFKNIVPVPSDLETIFKQLSFGRFDMLIEYPSEKERFWKKETGKTLYQYELSEANSYILGHLMCTKSRLNERFLRDFDNYLEKLYGSAVFFDTQYRKITMSEKERFIGFFNKEFKTN